MLPPETRPSIIMRSSSVSLERPIASSSVISQLLLPRAGAPGRVLALEVMIPNAAIRNLIREDKIHQVYTQMQVGQAKHGMQTLNQSLYSLYARRLITLEEAMGRSNDTDELRMMIEGRVSGGSLSS